MIAAKRIALALGKLLVACGLLYIAFGIGDAEIHRAVPSTIRLAMASGIGLLGLLIAPTISDVVVSAAKRGIELGSLGRRAYDGKIDPPTP